jgi:hypothetical protein
VRIRRPRGIDDLIALRIEPPVANVVLDRSGEEQRLLQNEADLIAQRPQRDIADVLPVQQNSSLNG